MNNDLDFTIESGLSLFAGCGVTFRDQFMYFGGKNDYSRQVNIIIYVCGPYYMDYILWDILYIIWNIRYIIRDLRYIIFSISYTVSYKYI